MKIPSSSLTEAKMVSAKQLVRFTNTAPHAKNNYFLLLPYMESSGEGGIILTYVIYFFNLN